jgi:hypothetical protein
MTITRRGILARLGMAGGLLGGLLLPRVAGARPAGHLAALHDLDAARRIGRAYLADHPGEADAAVLTTWLDQALGKPASVPAARAALRRAVRDDMRGGRSVVVDGWVLALTEARLCALAGLS